MHIYKINHVMATQKKVLSKNFKVEILQAIFYDHNPIKLE